MDNGFRWHTLSPQRQPDLQMILMKVDGPNSGGRRGSQRLAGAGRINGGVFQTDDTAQLTKS